ncbi:MAG: lysophospholipid acyltransferase family protein, partial [Isosphaeraceae bacterium]
MRLGWVSSRKGPLAMLLPGLRLLPPGMAARLAAGLGRAEYRVNPSLRRRYVDALARAGRQLGCDWDVPTLGRHLAGNQVRWRLRDRLFDGQSDARVAPLLRVDGRDHLDAALSEGRGAILLVNHFGAFLMPAHWLMRQGYPLRWLAERPRHVSRLLSKEFQTEGPTGQRRLFLSRKASPGESASAIMRAGRVLASGALVMIAGDVRWSGPNTASARFLGRHYTFTTTWAALAAVTGAPVLPAFGLMDPDGSHHIEFLPPFHVPPDALQTGTLSHWVQNYLDALEQQVRSHPDNSSDYFFWAESHEYQTEAG